MKFSLSFFGKYEAAYSPEKYHLILEAARFADEHGFHAVWVPERHFHPFGGFSPNPAVVCAALARETSKVQLRAGSVVLPIHHPIRVAEEWSVVDNLSDGRVGISFASGWHPTDFVFAPERFDRRKDRMFEGIETLRSLWRGETIEAVDGQGQTASVGCFPLPPRADIPLFITAVGNPETYIRAGERGFGILTNMLNHRVEDLAEHLDLYRRARKKAGHDPHGGHVAALVHTFVGNELEAVRARARGPFCSYIESHFGLVKTALMGTGSSVDLAKLKDDDRAYILSNAFEQYVDHSALVGTPESCVPILDSLRDAGVNEMACFIDFGVRPDDVLDGLRALAQLKDDYRRSPSASASAQLSTNLDETVKPVEVPEADQRMEPHSERRAVGHRPDSEAAKAVEEVGYRRGLEVPALTLPLTVAQREALTLVELAATDTAIGASVCFELKGPLRIDALRRALERLVERHETLRTTVSADKKNFIIARTAEIPIEQVDLSHTHPEDFQSEVKAWLIRQGRVGFDLVKGPVFRASLARFGDEHHVVLMATHHALCDGWSIGVLNEEMGALRP
ncbi:MAG: MupA/Atu3671 family FMN-dependent luciferase-like monooxygenase [Myxococcota bacterium]